MKIHTFKKNSVRYLVTLFMGLIMNIFFLNTSSFSYEIQALPGSSWGEISYEDNSLSGGGAMGHFKQGIDWMTLPWDITLNTFVEFRYRVRTENTKFYNVFGEAVGVQLEKKYFNLGLNYLWERFPNLAEDRNNVQFYLNWYYGWDLEKRGIINLSERLHILGLPGSSWGEISYEDNSLSGGGAMGHFKQGIDWMKLPGDITLNTFVEFRYRFRSERKRFYNVFGEAIGVQLKKGYFKLGINYLWERFPNLGEDRNNVQFYLNWYIPWDLKK